MKKGPGVNPGQSNREVAGYDPGLRRELSCNQTIPARFGHQKAGI